MLIDPGYDSNRLWTELAKRGTTPTKNRKVQFSCDKIRYRQRHCIENAFCHLKNWRRIATRYDRCAHTFFSAIWIAGTVTF